MQNSSSSLISTISDIEDFESTPLEKTLPYTSTWDLLSQAEERYGDSNALTFYMTGNVDEVPSSWNYTQLLGEVRRAANAFRALGVTDNTAVSIILPNLPEMHFALWGAQCAGIANPINPLLEPAHIAGILEAAGSPVLVTIAPTGENDIGAKAIEAAATVSTVKFVVLVDPTRHLKTGLTTSSESANLPPLKQGHLNILRYEVVTQAESEDVLWFERTIKAEDTASLFHTGGTTGVPKLARHSHLNEVFESWIAGELRQAKPGQLVLCGLPLFHVNGAIVTGLGVFATGAEVILATPQGYRTPGVLGNFWKFVEKHRINTFSCVPTILTTLLEQGVNADVSSLDYAICGAAPMSPSVFSQFEEATGVKILEGYGLTEGTCVSSLNPVGGERKVGSVGLRIPYQELQIVERGNEGAITRICDEDEAGEIVIRGPNVFPGYTDQTKNVGVLLDDGWLVTGDIGRIDSDGFLWLTGREKDLIIRGGHNIDPAIIENALAAHPTVALAAAVGQIDGYAGELPVAYVTLNSDSAFDESELIDYLRGEIAERAAVPVRIDLLEEMPTTTVGKIFKPALRSLAAEHVLHAALRSNSIPLDSLEITQDPKYGLSAKIAVSDNGAVDQARKVIGQYAIHSDVSAPAK